MIRGNGSDVHSLRQQYVRSTVVLPPALTLDPPNLPTGWRQQLLSQHRSGAVLASVCSGAFLLAETGLLDGRRVTTHWRHAAVFQKSCPKAIIDTNRLLVDLGDIVTAGGVMSWTDLTLHLIDWFGGRKLMLEVARMFVLDPPEREQSYYATFLPNTKHTDQKILSVKLLMQETPGATHSVSSLAECALMSERSFLRRLKQATGITPVTYLQHLRVEATRSRLELTRDSFERICWDVGYSDTAAFRRVFKRIVGLSPTE
ncbi:helix-turn-helix domain-containing protein [Pseudophaeobacter sp.]|uniref:GlxA family transcriptional regulator n=1 Tax=Pseudophaeobacter sp. TaxID=1971739 RepID=UPI0032992571